MDEVAGLVKRFMGGLEVTAETLALDVIDQVGPGGHFLEEDHTYRHFRQNWYPILFDRKPREDWEIEGQRSMGERATAKVQEILETHQPSPVDEAVLTKLEAVIQQAEARVAPGN